MVGNISTGWRVLGESIRGASHIAHGQPNQDVIQWWQSAGDLPLIIAVADGHGSARSFRSQMGAQIAVEVAIGTMRNFLDDQTDNLALSTIKDLAEDRLSYELTRVWKDRVETQIAQNPFGVDDLEKLKGNGKGFQSVEVNPWLAYGTTIMSVLVTDTFIVYLQLGDGDILTVSAQAEVARPFLKDGRFLANETTSLCMSDADQEVRIGFAETVTGCPALILLCTDGYSNSFRDDENFLKIGSDLFEVIQREGLSVVHTNLNRWLNQASQGGSGDDITLGIVCRADAFETP
jgi:serine/threonine protein phosphatase PrpC